MTLEEATELFRKAHEIMSDWTSTPMDKTGFPVGAETSEHSGHEEAKTDSVDSEDPRHDPAMAGSSVYDQMTPIEQTVFDSQVRAAHADCKMPCEKAKWKKGINAHGMIRTCLVCLHSEKVDNEVWKNTPA